MNSLGIDVSKGKSTVAALRPMGEVALSPTEYLHTELELEKLAYTILALGEDTRVVMEATGRYHEPVATALHEYGIYVCVLNPILIHQSGGGSVRKVKSDKKDAIKIAKYGLDNWVALREYTPVDALRQQLKLFSRQYNLYMKNSVALSNNLISLTDKVFPGVNELFSSPEKADGHRKWVDFVETFWHCDCISLVSEKAFIERYRKWCKRKGYNFSVEKAFNLYASSCGNTVTLPKNDTTKRLITTAAKQLTSFNCQPAAFRNEMISIARQLPEFDTVLNMFGVWEISAVNLIAEIGDVRRFPNRNSLVGFAGVDPCVDQSGKHFSKSNPTTKRGSAILRKTLFQVISTYVKRSPVDEPVYQFICKKRAEGKPYYVCTTAAYNKFLRIYYARVKECLNDNLF